MIRDDEQTLDQADAPAATAAGAASEVPLTVAAAVHKLPERLQTLLALLSSVDDGLAELTLAALPADSRDCLADCGVIEPSDRREVEAVSVRLTEFGREVSAACELAQAPQAVRDAIGELAEARARWEAEAHKPTVRAVPSRSQRRGRLERFRSLS